MFKQLRSPCAMHSESGPSIRRTANISRYYIDRYLSIKIAIDR